ncbi:MAG: hypothetical protein KA419_04730 [Acidobacteria bacterium]|nr:hypothetical protein [Acidobacteriota bacterium]
MNDLNRNIGTVFTHIDFDGIGSAAVLGSLFTWGGIRFTTPKQIVYDNVTDRDAVLDLPFSRRCAWWFDHHEQNFEEPSFHGIAPAEIPGLRVAAPSCARVILRWFAESGFPCPDHFQELADEIDLFDSMLFDSIDEWLEETPGKVVNDSLTLPDEHHRARDQYYTRLANLLKTRPLEACASDPEVNQRYCQYRALTEKNRDMLRKISRFHPEDDRKQLVILDFTPLKFQPFVDRKHILIDYPEVEYILCIYPYYQGQTKTNTLSLSISRNFLKKSGNGYDWGKHFAELEIGGGHRDAAGARLEAATKAQRDKGLEDFTRGALARIRSL